MKKFYKGEGELGIVIVLAVLGLAIYGGYILFSSNGRGQQELYRDEENYSKKLWDRLSTGDITSVQCQEAEQKYAISNPQIELVGNYFFSYEKKRCLGFETSNIHGENNKYIGSTASVFDLITKDVFVSCTTDNSLGYIVVECSDNSSTWRADSSNKIIPPPYPIYSRTWLPLRKIGSKI